MKINKPIFVIAALYSLFETVYFGWNMTPKSPAEEICDGISVLILALAFLGRD